MQKNRLEAFSDGVLAIIITIMVLEMKVPHGNTLVSLEPVLPVFLSYVLSFLYLAIYWNNHHHLIHVTKKINSSIMWANIHLLFWLSLVPFVSGWLGANHGGTWPTVLYGLVLLMAGGAYTILQNLIFQHQPNKDVLLKTFGIDWKGKISLVIYALAIVFAFRYQYISYALYLFVAMLWMIPDRRIERVLGE